MQIMGKSVNIYGNRRKLNESRLKLCRIKENSSEWFSRGRLFKRVYMMFLFFSLAAPNTNAGIPLHGGSCHILPPRVSRFAAVF